MAAVLACGPGAVLSQKDRQSDVDVIAAGYDVHRATCKMLERDPSPLPGGIGETSARAMGNPALMDEHPTEGGSETIASDFEHTPLCSKSDTPHGSARQSRCAGFANPS